MPRIDAIRSRWLAQYSPVTVATTSLDALPLHLALVMLVQAHQQTSPRPQASALQLPLRLGLLRLRLGRRMEEGKEQQEEAVALK